MKPSPVNELILQKQLASKFNNAPATRQFQSSNPLIPEEDLSSAFKSMRAQVPSYKQQSETAQPKSLGRGEYYSQSRGSLTFTNVPSDDFKPSRKYIPTVQSELISPSHRKLGISNQKLRNPILEGEENARNNGRGHYQPAHTSGIGGLLKGEMHDSPVVNPSRYEQLYTRNKSNLFDLPSEGSGSMKKQFVNQKFNQAGSILNYEFAPKFREDNVVNKVSESSLNQDAYLERKASSQMAEIYKMRRNHSGFTLQ